MSIKQPDTETDPYEFEARIDGHRGPIKPDDELRAGAPRDEASPPADEADQPTIEDVYVGTPKHVLLPNADLEWEAFQEGSVLTISEIDDDENGAWIQSSETMEIRE